MTAVYLGDHTSLAMTRYGHYMYVDTRDVSIAPHILLKGDWEAWVSTALMSRIPRDGVFVDVGANCGWYSLLALRCQSKHVHAYEPNPRLATLLSRSLCVNGLLDRVTVREAACGATQKRATLTIPAELFGGASLKQIDGTGIEVNVVRLDDEIEHADFIKIDVEGYEFEVLKGCERILGSPGIRLAVEHNGDMEMYHWLRSRGFKLSNIETDASLRAVSIDDIAHLPHASMIYCQR
jgi:FkbM family methyltransferase